MSSMGLGNIFSPSEDVPEYYVDSVRVAANAFTFIFELGLSQIPDTASSETPPTKRVALVRMSPHHALVLSKVLEDQLSQYQQSGGTINLPRSDEPA